MIVYKNSIESIEAGYHHYEVEITKDPTYENDGETKFISKKDVYVVKMVFCEKVDKNRQNNDKV